MNIRYPNNSECEPNLTNSIILLLGSNQINKKSPWM